MRLIGNIIWLIFLGGIFSALAVFLLGTLLTLLVIPSPIGLGLIQYSKFLLLPFSYSMVSRADLNKSRNPIWAAYSTIIMVLYLPLGIFLWFITVLQVIALCLTVIGIPTAIVLFKSLGTYLNPVNKSCVPVAVAYEIEDRKARKNVDSYFD